MTLYEFNLQISPKINIKYHVTRLNNFKWSISKKTNFDAKYNTTLVGEKFILSVLKLYSGLFRFVIEAKFAT